MLILAFGFLALCAALEYRARGEPLLRPEPATDRFWRGLGTLAGLVSVVGPMVVMARVDVAQGAGAYLLGAAFAFAGGFTPERWWGMTSVAAGVFGLGLLGGALLR
ncbi:hypothetical protein [Falsiroseomonas selenitidurans]|uniref:Uncharacterized protein n=1 Tax=Falsiroseomonas selenitidurans TaxID=2716335 RepID=A0ABX1EB62_9PROT|nr:hypothetical protein [Falsiroseomonas selenitidurans]NKC34475.1 hypothetical protein [Falsiroseomonas selenitidurans]